MEKVTLFLILTIIQFLYFHRNKQLDLRDLQFLQDQIMAEMKEFNSNMLKQMLWLCMKYYLKLEALPLRIL